MSIDRAKFAEECVRQGVIFRVDPHYILGAAQLRSGISDDSSGERIGPFRLTQAEWNANRDDNEFDVHFTPEQITSTIRQCVVYGLMANRAFDAFSSANGRNPSVKELYLQQWPQGDTPTLVADLQKALDGTAALIGPAAAAVLDDPKSVSPIRKPDQSTTRPLPPANPAGGPEWYALAIAELGKREIGDTNNGPEITRYRGLARCGSPGDPWCAIFVNAMLALCKNPTVSGTKSALSRSFADHRDFVKLAGPAKGAVVVFWRISPNSGKGHVGFYFGETADSVDVLGGNEDNMVQIAPTSKKQLIGHYWPASVALPAIGKIVVPPGTPRRITKLT